MDNRAKVEQAVFDFLRPQLKRYREDSTDLARSAASSIAKVNQQAEDAVDIRRRQLKRAQEELERCQAQEDADCSGFRRRVQECERALERAIQGRQLVREASARFQHQQNKHTATIDQFLLRAEKLVRTADDKTTSYQKMSQYIPRTTALSAPWRGGGSGSVGLGPSLPTVSSSGGGGGTAASPTSASWRDLPGVSVPTSFPDGFALVPTNLIVNDNPVTGDSDFDAGQNLRELRWSTDALIEVVLPAMDKIAEPRNYLSERDVRENLSGGRSYVASYDGFFNQSSAMRLSPRADGKFDLVNGRHRLWLISRADGTHVPALIGGGVS